MFFNQDYSNNVCKNKIDLDVQPSTYTHKKCNDLETSRSKSCQCHQLSWNNII
jgi:hypothetical protein